MHCDPFKNYCAPSTIISRLVLFLWKTVEIDPLGHVRVVEALQNFVQKCDPMLLPEFHIHIAGVPHNVMLEFTLLSYCLRRSSFKMSVARGALSPS